MTQILDQKNRRTLDKILNRISNRCRVRSTAAVSAANDTWTKLEFAEALYDPSGMFSPSAPNRITLTNAGTYSIGANFLFAANDTGRRSGVIHYDTPSCSINIAYYTANALSTGGSAISMNLDFECIPGSYVECWGYQTSGGALNVISAMHYTAQMWVHKIG